jgi:hypothetical protein
MAPKPEPRVVFFFGMALTLLAIMTWLSRDLAARGPRRRKRFTGLNI